jgi:hypothetical protein
MRLTCVSDKAVHLINDHTGEVLEWDVSIFERTKLPQIEDVFREVNDYWAFIGANRQLRIFAIYKEIHSVWLSTVDIYQMGQVLMGLLERLYNEMPREELEHWVKFHAKVRYQEGLLHEYKADDTNPGRTYLYADYQGLVVLTVAVRPMVPIWGEYIDRVKKELGGMFKEFFALKLMARTWVVTSPYADRLRLYIESSNLHTATNNAAIIQGLGSDELPEFLLAFVIVRRISVGDINFSPEHGSIISNIYGFVSTMLGDFDRRFGGRITDKNPEDSGGDDESSLLETYKVKQSVTIGDVETFLIYMEDIYRLTDKIDPTVPRDLIDYCVQNTSMLQTMPISQFQLTFCQWLIAKVLPPKSIPLLNKPTLLRIMGAVQAILWHWGFQELACLMTSAKLEQGNEMMMMADIKTRISNDLLDTLNQLYPHADQAEKQGSARRSNVAYSAALGLMQLIAANPWQILAPEAMRKTCPQVNAKGIMSCPGDIVERILKLVIRINQKPAVETAHAV